MASPADLVAWATLVSSGASWTAADVDNTRTLGGALMRSAWSLTAAMNSSLLFRPSGGSSSVSRPLSSLWLPKPTRRLVHSWSHAAIAYQHAAPLTRWNLTR